MDEALYVGDRLSLEIAAFLECEMQFERCRLTGSGSLASELPQSIPGACYADTDPAKDR